MLSLISIIKCSRIFNPSRRVGRCIFQRRIFQRRIFQRRIFQRRIFQHCILQHCILQHCILQHCILRNDAIRNSSSRIIAFGIAPVLAIGLKNLSLSILAAFQLLAFHPPALEFTNLSKYSSSHTLSMLARQPAPTQISRSNVALQPLGPTSAGSEELFVAAQSEQILGLISHSGDPTTLAITAGGKVFGVLSDRTLSRVPKLNIGHAVQVFVGSPDGTLLAVGNSNQVEVWSLVTLKRIAVFDKIKARASALVFQVDNKALLIGGADGRIYRWRFGEPSDEIKESDRYIGSPSVVSAIAFHPNSRLFFSGDWEGGLNAWLRYDSDRYQGAWDRDLLGGRFFTDQATRVNAGRAVAAAPVGAPASEPGIDFLRATKDGRFILLASQSGTFEWWSVRGLKKLTEFQAHRGPVFGVELTADEDRVVSLGRDGKAKVIELPQRIPATPGPDGIPIADLFGAVVETDCSGCRAFFVERSDASTTNLVAVGRDGKLLALELKGQSNEPP